MDKKSITWLCGELPRLVEQGVVPPEIAENLRRYYGQTEPKERKRSLLSIFAVIGFLLIALGIVLILAHNWETMTRPVRLAISVGVLLLAQLFAGFSLVYRREQTSFTESSSVFLTVMIGASIALVGQTYHLADDFDLFLLTWIFLALPLIYLMRSTAAAVLCLALAAFWATQTSCGWPVQQLAWLLLVAVLPFYRSLWLGDNYSLRRVTALGFAVAVFLPVCFMVSFHATGSQLWSFSWSALFAALYLADAAISPHSRRWRESPRIFRFFGCAGIIGISFLLSFRFPWYILAVDYLGGRLQPRPIEDGALLLAAVMLCLFIWLLAQTFRRLDRQQRLLAAAPAAAGLGCVLAYFAGSLGAALVMNIYLAAVALTVVITGVTQENLGTLNGGMLLLAALITARFFDAGISFEARGAAFVLIGLCLLAVNLLMVRRIKRRKGQV